ncbi:MAG: carbohydrate kinase [Alphaproteobacteria bacterium]|nr:carbohydrate kinase [Alphaproteobacteria bacterium]
MGLLLGIDIGTTSTIGILIEAGGGIVGTAARESTLYSDHPAWAEEDPGQWWDNACAVTRDLLRGQDPAGVLGVGVTGMVPALVALDAQGRVLRRSVQQNDARTAREIGEISAETSPAAFFAKTGNGINQQLVAPKLRWLERHEPDIFRRIATVMGSYDYIAHRLTGERTVERNWALEAGFLDVAKGTVDPDLVALGHIADHVVPPMRASHAVIGRITAMAAAATGLRAGTPVVAGCADHVASAFVAGVIGEGDLLIKFGGAGDVLLATDRARPDPRLFLDHHIVPGLFLTNGCMAASGSVLKWVAREFAARDLEAATGESVYARLDRQAEDCPPGAGGVVLLPYFLGEKTPIHDADARGTIVGLGLHHRLGHVWRAALEAVVYGFRHHIDVFGEIGLPVRRIVASDGGSASALWMQIAADALGAPVQLVTGHPGSSLGAAFVAGMGVGALDDWAAIGRFVTPGRVVHPNPATKGAYDEAYALYRELYDRLRPLFPRLARLGEAA